MFRKRLAIGLSAAVALSGSALLAAPAAVAAKPTVVVWADKDRASALVKASKSFKDATIKVVIRDFGKIRDDLKTVSAADAPDVTFGANDWIGELSSNGSIVRLSLPAAVKAQFTPSTLGLFSYNGALYGVPVQIENIAWIQNTTLMGEACPATMDAAISKFNTLTGVDTPVLVGPDAYHFYPMFSGLGGYVFGTKANGALDADNVGLDNRTFLKNSGAIDAWQKSGVFANYAGSYDSAQYKNSKAAVWITGPWNADVVKGITNFKSKFCAFPTIVPGIASVPLLGGQGALVTKFAKTHGVEAQAKKYVLNFLSGKATQESLSKLAFRAPANKTAKNADPFVNGFAVASKGAVPMPNIPEMGSVWDAWSGSWAKSLRKTDPVVARTAFAQGAATVRDLISK
jgi:arabinogalactan oligomer / maltooligosaccharide transport system substrate-binding protein